MSVPGYIDFYELKKRFELLGWAVEPLRDDSHYNFISPDGKTIINVGKHQYDDKPTRWQKIKSSFTRENKDLVFVWVSPFEIPEYFNLETQRIEEPEEDDSPALIKEIQLCNVPLQEIDKHVIRHENRWKKIADMDFNSAAILFKDGSILQLQDMNSLVTIKPSFTKEFLKKQKQEAV